MNRVDVHNHFLPGIDDGCRTVEESLACLRMMADFGYDRVFCTPHTAALEFDDLTTEDVARAVDQLRPHIVNAGIPIQIRPGGELRLTEDLPDHLGEVGIPTYGHSGKYVIADTWEPEWSPWSTKAVEWLQKKGLTVILAHPERMPVIRRNRKFIDELAKLGLLFQGNLHPIAQNDSSDINALAERFLKEGRYWMLGTDGHRIETLPPRLEGLAKAEKFVGKEKVAELTETNPGKLWE